MRGEGAGRIWALTALAGLSAALYLTLDVRGSWAFALAYRGEKLAAMAVVGCAIAVSTVLFQTVAGNRILTPAIMGFDALYGLIQTGAVFALGSGAATALDPRLRFVAETGAMVLFSVLLYRWLFLGARRSLHLMLLVGIVFGVLFRSLAQLLQRLIDPGEFLVVQDRLFASFGRAEGDLLVIAALLVAGVCAALRPRLPAHDALLLGREPAVGLGVAYRREVMVALVGVSLLVSVSTALVGPVTFFGLLAANLAYLVAPTHRHALVLPAATLVAWIALFAGQTVLERVFAFDTALAVVVEFAGGLFFLFLLVRGVAR